MMSLYQAIYLAGGEYHAMTYASWRGDAEAVDFAERFVKRLEPWYKDAKLTHVHPAPRQRLQLALTLRQPGLMS